MVTVTDPTGVQWSVRRRRWYDMSGSLSGISGSDGDILGFFLGLLLLPLFFVAVWPLWFIAHWLGLKWVIVIERDGKQMGHEEVRGWNRSGQRIQEIAELAAARTWQPAPARPDEWDNRFTRMLYRWFWRLSTMAAPPNPGEEGGTDDSRPPGTPEEVIRCVVRPLGGGRGRAIDVGKDAIWVIDLNTNALIGSTWLAQVTATPANHYNHGPVLVVGGPGLPPMTIRTSQIQRYWCGKVAKAEGAVYVAPAREWLTLVEKFGLAPSLSAW